MDSEWTTQNLQRLFASLKASIPAEEEASIYSKGLKHVDWEKVAFSPFSAEQCQEMWTCFMQKIRKIRTLKEIVEEAEGLVSSPNTSNTTQPECPKKPRLPNAIYFEENLEKLRREHPELNTQSLLKFSSKMFKKLPEEEKAQYEKKHNLECLKYKKQMQWFCQNYVTIPPQKKRKRRICDKKSQKHPDLPPKPPVSGYQLFSKEQFSSVKNGSKSSSIKEVAQRWQALGHKQKTKYAERCRELNSEYYIKMKALLKRFNKEERQQFIKENKISKTGMRKPPGLRIINRWQTEPKMPPKSGNTIFCREQMELLKDKIPNSNERFSKAMKMWRSLSKEKKADYREKRKIKMQQYSEDLQNWFLALTAQKKREYWMLNPDKRKFLNVNEELLKEEQSWETSDSEDEDSSNEEMENALNFGEKRKCLSVKKELIKEEQPWEPSDSEDEEIVISSEEEKENTLIFGEEEDYEQEEDEDVEIHMFEV